MELNNAEAAACIKALGLAARWEDRHGDAAAGRDFRAMRAALLGRLTSVSPALMSSDDLQALGLDPGGRFRDEPAPDQSTDITGARCYETGPHEKHPITGSFRGSCPGIP